MNDQSLNSQTSNKEANAIASATDNNKKSEANNKTTVGDKAQANEQDKPAVLGAKREKPDEMVTAKAADSDAVNAEDNDSAEVADNVSDSTDNTAEENTVNADNQNDENKDETVVDAYTTGVTIADGETATADAPKKDSKPYWLLGLFAAIAAGAGVTAGTKRKKKDK